MLATVKESYEKLIKSKEFKNEGFLCGLFLVSDIKEIDNSAWQIDFYDKDSDTITSYAVAEKIEVTPKSEIFKEENAEIEELKIEEVKTTLDRDFNISSNKIGINIKIKGEKKFTNYVLSITGKSNFEKFREHIGFYHPDKINRLNLMIDSYIRLSSTI